MRRLTCVVRVSPRSQSLAKELFAEYLPGGVWVDVWEGGLNISAYSRFAAVANVSGFSQQPTGVHNRTAYNTHLPDGIPLLLADQRLWYPEDTGWCNGSRTSPPSPGMLSCVQASIESVAAANPAPFWVLVYGQDLYVDVAVEMQKRLGDGFQLAGTQDAAALARAAGKSTH